MAKKSKPKKGGLQKVVPGTLTARGYREVAGVGTANTDWAITVTSEDGDLWQNAWLLTSRMRDLFRCNPLYIKYRELLWANVLGENGILLRSKVKETEDRVVHANEQGKAELRTLIAHETRINRLRTWAAKKTGNTPEQYRAFKIADELEKRDFETVLRGKAVIEVGALDVFANQMIERKWLEWQRMENCDTGKRRNYKTLRQLRLISAVRDGEFFIRLVKHPNVNKFGLALQTINAEWCDRWFNTILPNGNEVRMGIEYQFSPWGIEAPVAYYFLRRMPMDWQWTTPSGMFGNENLYVRVPADEIIHYCRVVDADSTRPAPWAASTIPKARQLDQYELAEVISAREQACKTGFYTSTVIPDGGEFTPPDPTGLRFEGHAPGETRGLPWGVEYTDRNPTHPNGNFEAFRKAMLRSDCAGMPGADYSRMANDYEAINFSAGRLQMLDTNEIYKLIQRFDIEYAEIPIFEAWLEMSLITGAIPLPLAKFEKFNRPVFQARRWRGVDEVKEETASAMRIANKKNSRQRETGEEGADWEEIVFELAEEEMLLESLGMSTTTTAETPVQETDPDADTEEADGEPKPEKPAKKAKAKALGKRP